MDPTKLKTNALLKYGETLQSYGGYVPNFRGVVFYDKGMDKHDNPLLGREIECLRRSSVSKDTYQPPNLLTGKECLPREVQPSQTGFSSMQALHNARYSDVLKADRDQFLICSVDPKGHLRNDCTYDRMSESKENFSKFTIRKVEPDVYSPIIGSRDTGFTSNHGGLPNTLDGRHLDPIYIGMTPDWKIGQSTTHEAYSPQQLRTGYEYPVPLSSTASPISGFNRALVLKPCYSRGYGRPDPCKNQYETSYLVDYPWKNNCTFVPGQEVYGKGFPGFAPSGINLFQGCGAYTTETSERFVDPTLIGRARGGHLRGAVDPTAPTAFSRSTSLHSNKWFSPCIPNTSPFASFYNQEDMPPQRYNPFPRLWLKHQSQLDKNYRPNPVSEGIDYELRRIQAGSPYEQEATPL